MFYVNWQKRPLPFTKIQSEVLHIYLCPSKAGHEGQVFTMASLEDKMKPIQVSMHSTLLLVHGIPIPWDTITEDGTSMSDAI
jgi:hypothetical protein